MKRVLGAVVICLGLLFQLSAPADAHASPAATRKYVRDTIHATNSARTHRGRRALRMKRCLMRKARKQAYRMAYQTRMFHQRLGPVLGKCNLNFAGENVAYGFPNGHDLVWQGWMQSPGHRENILDRRYHLIGVGAARGRNGLWYVSEVFGRHK